ncbi:MAG TPA: PDZ domain-containing protein [Pirellulales bacterium]|jgi:hypothetical protein|nr:PDZ domain-containing protein [Pirellulales bacterium]
MKLRLAICLGCVGQFLAGAALAQPALDRVEQQLRGQVPTRTAAADDNDADKNKNAGYLGILGDDRQENGKGVRITRTDAGGPAAKGGLKTSDLITAIDEQPVKSMEEMGEIMAALHAGAVVKFSIDRAGETRDVQVRLERRPPPEQRLVPEFGKQAEDLPIPGAPAPGGPAPGGAAGPPDLGSSIILNTRRPKMGIRTEHLTPFMREQFRLPGSYVAGVFVSFVDPDSPAGKAGLPKTAIITSVDGAPIDSPDTLAALVHRAVAGQVLNVSYYFHDHETLVAVTLAGGPPQPPTDSPQATMRAKPVPRTIQPPVQPPAQPPGFTPDEPSLDELFPEHPPTDKIADLERRIDELEKRVAEIEAAGKADGADKK